MCTLGALTVSELFNYCSHAAGMAGEYLMDHRNDPSMPIAPLIPAPLPPEPASTGAPDVELPELTAEDIEEYEAFRTFREAARDRIRETLGPRRGRRRT